MTGMTGIRVVDGVPFRMAETSISVLADGVIYRLDPQPAFRRACPGQGSPLHWSSCGIWRILV